MKYEFDFSFIAEYWPLIVEGAWTTMVLSLWATALGFLLGVAAALCRGSERGWVRALASIYVESIRNTPLLVQAYFLIFGLSSIGVTIAVSVGAVLALTINIGAYSCEIIRAGIESVKRGQLEAAECLGLSRWQVMLKVTLRIAIERVYPSLASQYILLMLASSLMAAVGAEELFGVSSRIQSETFRNFEIFLVLWAMYLALSYAMRLLFWLIAQVAFPRKRRLGTTI